MLAKLSLTAQKYIENAQGDWITHHLCLNKSKVVPNISLM